MSRRARQVPEGAGQDSFLDIVANLVGILIILIMVVGVRAKDALLAASRTPPPTEQVEELARAVKQVESETAALEGDFQRLQGNLQQLALEIDYRRRERDRFLQLIKTAELTLDEQRNQLTQSEQQQYDHLRQLAALNSQLEDLKRSQQSLKSLAPPSDVIEHLPTPLAQTVFGKELHFRLERGRLTYVPLEELVEQLKAEAPQKLWKLNQAEEITEVLGPLGGFRMKYTLRQITQSVPTRGGAATQRRIELDHFVLLPVRDDLGTPLAEALREGSELDTILAGERPKQTTVTVWVYPDSFDGFRQLKEHLFRRGFLSAGRPLPAGVPIGGSPDGSRSSAQ